MLKNPSDFHVSTRSKPSKVCLRFTAVIYETPCSTRGITSCREKEEEEEEEEEEVKPRHEHQMSPLNGIGWGGRTSGRGRGQRKTPSTLLAAEEVIELAAFAFKKKSWFQNSDFVQPLDSPTDNF